MLVYQMVLKNGICETTSNNKRILQDLALRLKKGEIHGNTGNFAKLATWSWEEGYRLNEKYSLSHET
jgi:hypothetical protein